MLGLGGVAAATGLAAGAKVLGGKVAPAVTIAPLATKTVKHDELYCPKFWAQEARRMLEEQLPARDFAALPGPCTDKVNVHKPRPRDKQADKSGVAVFKNGDMEAIITLSEGEFNFTVQRDIIYDRSAMDGLSCRWGDKRPTECNLNGCMESVRGVALLDVLHADGPFELELVQGSNKYIFKGCRWTALDHDMTDGYFDVEFTCLGEQTVSWVE